MKLGSYGLTYAIFLLSLLSYLLITNHKRKPQRKAELPPGSMGWPLIGETLHLYTQNPNLFFATKQKRYGEIFKTHLLGCPCVMLASPEASKFVLVNRAHLFKPTYPPGKERMIGPRALFFHEGPYHARLRRLVQSSFSPDAVRELIPDIEAVVISMLESWDGHVASTFQVMKKFSFNVTILAIFGGGLDKSYREELERNYLIINNGYNSFPTRIPGTRYNKAIRARKRLDKILREIMSERRKKLQAADDPKDLLRRLMESRDEEGGYLTDDQIADNIIGVLFAGQDTTASVITWIIKYLHDDQKLLETVKAEQIAIQRENQSLTWAQIRSMALTNRVLLESLRMASIISFTFREAVADVEYKGYLIPKGWKVMPLFRNIHHNPDFFVDPEKLEPSRFKVPPKPNTFLPFGNGVHACPGNELAKIEVLLLIHHLVTKYRLEVDGSTSEVEYSPFPVPKHGFRAQLLCIRDSNSVTAAATTTV